MSSKLTIDDLTKTLEFLKRPTAPSAAALMSPRIKQQLLGYIQVETLSTALGVFKIFVSTKCPDDCYYVGSEMQMLDMLERLETD